MPCSPFGDSKGLRGDDHGHMQRSVQRFIAFSALVLLSCFPSRAPQLKLDLRTKVANVMGHSNAATRRLSQYVL